MLSYHPGSLSKSIPMKSLPSVPPPQDNPSFRTTKNDSSFQDSIKGISDPSLNAPEEVVSLSTSARDITPYLESLAPIPDIREARITSIQNAIASHSYFISGEVLADKILQDLYSRTHEIQPPLSS